MGAGAALLAGTRRCTTALSGAGWAPTVQRILAADPGVGEVTRIFDLLRAQAAAVRARVRRGAFPLVLAGGCISATGTVAGCGADGAVWLDAHADFDTPEDNVSGSMDVMALSILMRLGLAGAAATIPGAVATRAEERVRCSASATSRDYQRDRLAASAPAHARLARSTDLGRDAAITARPRSACTSTSTSTCSTRPSVTPTATRPPGGPSWRPSWRAIDADLRPRDRPRRGADRLRAAR